MSQTPNFTSKPYQAWQKITDGADFLQLAGPNGSVLGWIDSTGAGRGALSPTGPNSFDASSYGAAGDAHIWFNCSATVGTSPQVITCPDGNFLTTVAPGMTAWGQAANGGVFVNGTSVPRGTVLSIQSNTQVTVSGTVATTCAANCAFIAGHVDESPANPALSNFYKDLTAACGQGVLKAGVYIATRAFWNDFFTGTGANVGCQQNGGRNTRQTPSIRGAGSMATIIALTPDFDTSGCTFQPTGYPVPGCIGCPTNGFGLTLIGIGFTGLGASPANAGGKTILCSGVLGQNWGLTDIQCTGIHGFRYGLVTAGGTTPYGLEGGGVDIDGCGGDDGNALQANVALVGDDIHISGLTFAGDSSGPGLIVTGNDVTVDGAQICSTGGVVVLASGTNFSFVNGHIGGNPCPSVNSQVGLQISSAGIPEIHLNNVLLDPGTGGTNPIDIQAPPSAHSRISAQGTFFVNRAGSTCFDTQAILVYKDLGDNRESCATYLNNHAGAGTFVQVGVDSFDRLNIGSGAFTLPAGSGAGQWGTSPSISCTTLSTNTNWECTITVGSGTVGANPQATLTFSNNSDANAFAGTGIALSCTAFMIGGTAALATLSRVSVNSTTFVFQYNGTPGASSTILVKGGCS